MRCLLDENVHQGLVAFLTDLGHDVRRSPKGLANGAVFALAVSERRVLVTHDKDFAARPPPLTPHPGIILLRIVPKDLDRLKAALHPVLTPSPTPDRFADRLVLVFPDRHDDLPFRSEWLPFHTEGD